MNFSSISSSFLLKASRKKKHPVSLYQDFLEACRRACSSLEDNESGFETETADRIFFQDLSGILELGSDEDAVSLDVGSASVTEKSPQMML